MQILIRKKNRRKQKMLYLSRLREKKKNYCWQTTDRTSLFTTYGKNMV